MSTPSTTPFVSADPASQAKISYAPVPAWVQPASFDPHYARKEGLPLTYLLVEEQQHAEERCHHSRLVARLETMQAVQQMSQWRTSFDPLTQSVVLHHLRVHRGETVTDYARPEHVRVLQREENLDAFILHGRVTVLVVFNDVRPGDIIETCYSIVHTPRLLPDKHSAFHTLPDAFPVARYHLSLAFASTRPMRWKSSAPDQKPDEATDGPLTRWTWRGEDRVAVTPEPNVPGWELQGFWIQVSDVADWSEVSAAAATAWASGKNDDPEALDACLRETTAGAEEPLARIERLLRFVQDDFRYLSVNLELGGYIPSPPAGVLRRRYGDCKDLSLLLSCLLQKLDVKARPVLVNTGLGKSLESLLPGANMFNHAIVEIEIGGQTRWIDATLHRQGGGPLNRWIPRYDFGLPIDLPGETLAPQPKPERETDFYEIHETLLVDTAGNPSLLKIATRATGRHAEGFRLQVETEGVEGCGQSFAKQQSARYVNAVQAGKPTFEDDREANEWRMVEVYQVTGFTVHNHAARRREFALPPNFAVTALPLPDKEARTRPFAVPADLHIEHTIEVRSRAFHQLPAGTRLFKQLGVTFKLDAKYQPGRWSRRAVLTTTTDAIQPRDIEAFRKLVEGIWSATAWTLSVADGIPRQRRGVDFANLPPPLRKIVPLSSGPSPKVGAPESAASAPPAKPLSQPGTVRRRRRPKKSNWLAFTLTGLLVLAGLAAGVWVYYFA